jgi:3-phosphoglycerate kinase
LLDFVTRTLGAVKRASALGNPKRPFVAVIGGSKVSGKMVVARGIRIA